MILLKMKNNSKSKIESLYDEVKNTYILNKQNKEYVEDYFKKKKFYLNKKPHQVISIINNSLNNINYVNIEKKSRKVYGYYYPQNIIKHFDNLERIDNDAKNVKRKIINSLCKSKIDEQDKFKNQN